MQHALSNWAFSGNYFLKLTGWMLRIVLMMLTAVKKYNNRFPNLAFQLEVTAKNPHELVQYALLQDFASLLFLGFSSEEFGHSKLARSKRWNSKLTLKLIKILLYLSITKTRHKQNWKRCNIWESKFVQIFPFFPILGTSATSQILYGLKFFKF